MTQAFKILTIIFFLSTVTACGVSQNKHQPLANPGQLDKRHDIPQPITNPGQLDEKHDIHVTFSFDTGNDQGTRVSGFRLYREGKLICVTKDPNSKSIDCNITSPGGSFLFTMTTIFEDGSESRHSEPFTFTIRD